VSPFGEQNREGNHGITVGALPRSLSIGGGRRAPAVFAGSASGEQSLLRQKVSAARPTDTGAASLGAAAARAAVDTAPATVESLGRQLMEALSLRRVSSISIWDGEASVQWLNEGALGPDEHSLVLEAFDRLNADKTLASCEIPLEDGRYSLFLPVRTPSGNPVGVAMILSEAKSVGEGAQERLASAAVRTIMQRLAVLMKPAGVTTTSLPALSLLELVPESEADADAAAAAPAPVSPAPAAMAASRAASAPAAPAAISAEEQPDTATSGISPQAVSDLLEFELAVEDSGKHVTPASAHTALPGAAGTSDEIALLQFIEPPTVSAAPAAAAAAAKSAPAPAAPAAPTRKPAAAALASAVAAASAIPSRTAAAARGPRPVVVAASPAPAPKAAPAPVASPAPAVRGASRLSAVAARVNAAVERARSLQSVPTAAPAAAAPARAPSEVAPAVPSEPQSEPVAEVTAAVTTVSEIPQVTAAPVAEPTRQPAPPAASAVAEAPQAVSASDANLLLEIVQFGKLRPGGQSRRFQIHARTGQQHARYLPAALDTLILERLVSWLAANRSGWSAQPTSFTVNLSIATLEDERFVQRVAHGLNANGLSPEVLGFEITEALCTQRRALVERFLTQCEKLGPWVVVDDFSFDSQVVPLLRSKAVRLVKIDHKLTSLALKDKLSQALVIATIQAVKVLGIHCAAKQIESQALVQWLTAVGCDFAQGTAFAGPQPLEALLRTAGTAG
jgi:EAL domain-containing protein (putative c-di-GMP-specific phosphodiesterase class I)